MHKTNILLPVNSRLVKIDISTLSTALLYFICLIKHSLKSWLNFARKNLEGYFIGLWTLHGLLHSTLELDLVLLSKVISTRDKTGNISQSIIPAALPSTL